MTTRCPHGSRRGFCAAAAALALLVASIATLSLANPVPTAPSNSTSPVPITEIPSIAFFYLDGDIDPAYALVADKDSALTIMSRSHTAPTWRVAGTKFFYFALDRVLAAAGIGKAGTTRVLGEMSESMGTMASSTACNWHGFCSISAAGAPPQCVCDEGFTGASCAPDRGTCADPTQPAVCKCMSGFTGATCSMQAVTPTLTLRASNRFENKGSAEDNDDPEAYMHPMNPDDSVVLGTTKSKNDGGLHVWAMDGAVPLTDYLHRFDKDTELEVHGSCAFTYTPKTSPTPADTLLEPTASLTLARHWTVGLGTQLEKCVGDGETNVIYIGEEAIGVWRYDLGEFDATEPLPAVPKPAGSSSRSGHRTSARDAVLVDSTKLANLAGQMQRDVEGLAIYIDPACPHAGRLGAGRQRVSPIYDQGAEGDAVPRESRDPGGRSWGRGEQDGLIGRGSARLPVGCWPCIDDATTVGEDLSRVEKGATFKVVDWRDVEKRVQTGAAAAAR
ncbi:hypothetical protein GGF32_002214 [Allomyces javanicus]|nr:hypothetical protein GGF32_002214 [Allomyces javanicus]